MAAEPARSRTILPPPGELSLEGMLRAIAARPEPARAPAPQPPPVVDERPTVPGVLLPF